MLQSVILSNHDIPFYRNIMIKLKIFYWNQLKQWIMKLAPISSLLFDQNVIPKTMFKFENDGIGKTFWSHLYGSIDLSKSPK